MIDRLKVKTHLGRIRPHVLGLELLDRLVDLVDRLVYPLGRDDLVVAVFGLF